MGKNLISQRRGKGTSVFKSHGFRYAGVVKHHPYSEEEKTDKIEGTVTDIVHSAGHYAPIAKVAYKNSREEALEIAPFGIRVGEKLNSGINAEINDGNILPLSSIPEGTFIFNIESMPGDGGKFVRSSGSFARVITKSGNKVTVMLPSKKERTFSASCRATIGIISGGGRPEKPMLKAGLMAKKRGARGRLYPHTSALSMNAVAHPFGGSSSSAKNGPMIARKNAPAGAKVGSIRPRRTGRKRR